MSPSLAARPAAVLPLAGTWRFRLDPDDAGLRAAWQNTALPQRIHLPGTTDEAGYGEKTVGSAKGVLTRVHQYYGPAWYQRDIVIPASWRGKRVELFMERVLWESRVWVDGRYCNAQDSLNTPHVHDLGPLPPGRHCLTIRISNAPIYPIGDLGHSYTEQTQTIWNGAVGRLELRAREPVQFRLVRAFPDAAARRMDVAVDLLSERAGTHMVPVRLKLTDRTSGRSVASWYQPVGVPYGGSSFRFTLPLRHAPRLWDEFHPNLYTLSVSLGAPPRAEERTVPVGFRSIERQGLHITVNGRRAFFRGNLDCVHFPLTGYPPTDVAAWRRLFRIYKSYGLNSVRFHSWTPPDAAFQAADEAGIYIECEVIWSQRRIGRDTPGPPEGSPEGMSARYANQSGTVDGYVRSEMRRANDAYGNHPSFVVFCIGNELGGLDLQEAARWLRTEKAHDPRRLYAGTTAYGITPADEYNVRAWLDNVGMLRDRVEPFNDWDYEAFYAKALVPIIAHEVGQWPSYPLWSEIPRYTGVTRARNLEGFREAARRNGVLDDNAAMHAASGALAMRLYKDEIESHLRTPDCSGFDLLSMQDFSGQGEALVGWLDSFYSSKGYVSPDRFRRWCAPVVVLARLPRYVYTSDATVSVAVEVANYGPAPITNARIAWRLLSDRGAVLQSGALPAFQLADGGVRPVGSFNVPLSVCKPPCRVRLEAAVEGTPYANDWDLWVFPGGSAEPAPAGVTVCSTLRDALPALRQGAKVLLMASGLGRHGSASLANWKPVYWSAAWFGKGETLGALVRSRHPALAGFPTESSLDWQWYDICKGARGFVLDGMPAAYKPIVQPISDFHFSHKLGSIFEVRTAEGGRLLTCGYDLATDIEKRPAARQLLKSLLDYMAGPAFVPTQTVTEHQLRNLFPDVAPAPLAGAPDVAQTALYVNAGAKHTTAGNVRWTPEADEVVTRSPGYGYSVQCDGAWKDETDTAWHAGKRLYLEITVPTPGSYDLYVHFRDWNNLGRTGAITIGNREYALGPHNGEGVWVKLPVTAADFANGKVSLDALCDTGPNLQISAIAIVG